MRADYIHLNPARAGLAGGKHGKLVSDRWSSLRHYAKGKGPEWQPLERVLEAFQLSKDRRGRQSYVSWLEARAAQDGGKIGDEAMAALRRGWYLGEEGFRDKLVKILEKAGVNQRKKGSLAGAALQAHDQTEAERIISLMSHELGLPQARVELMRLKKSDQRKVVCAALVKERTAVSNTWITERLAMGHPASMSQHVNQLRRDTKALRVFKKYEQTLKSKG